MSFTSSLFPSSVFPSLQSNSNRENSEKDPSKASKATANDNKKGTPSLSLPLPIKMSSSMSSHGSSISMKEKPANENCINAPSTTAMTAASFISNGGSAATSPSTTSALERMIELDIDDSGIVVGTAMNTDTNKPFSSLSASSSHKRKNTQEGSDAELDTLLANKRQMISPSSSLVSSPDMSMSSLKDALSNESQTKQSHFIEDILAGKKAISTFLRSLTCYKIAPKSGRVVVFDTAITFRLVYYALVEHELECAPLYDSQLQKFIGMITLNDIASVLRVGYRMGELASIIDYYSPKSWSEIIRTVRANPSKIIDIEKSNFPAAKSIRATALNPQAISTGPSNPSLHDISSLSGGSSSLLVANPDQSIFDLCGVMKKNRIHSLPLVIEESNSFFCLCVISQRNILDYLISNFRDNRKVFDIPLRELELGTYMNSSGIQGNGKGYDPLFAQSDHYLVDILNQMVIYEVSSIPIIDIKTKRLVDVYSIGDLLYLPSRDDFENCGKINISSILEEQRRGNNSMDINEMHILHGILPIVTINSTLTEVILKFAECKSDIVVIAAGNEEFIGVIYLSELLSYFIRG